MSPHTGRATGRSILVVDHSAPVRKLTCRMLANAGYEVYEATDGLTAMEMVAGSVPIDAVLSDIRMPNMNGWELAGRLAARTPPVPVLLMSGFDVHLASAQLFGPVLAKPFDAARLIACVAEMLSPLPSGGFPE